jgi:hypothetical protein
MSELIEKVKYEKSNRVLWQLNKIKYVIYLISLQ